MANIKEDCVYYDGCDCIKLPARIATYGNYACSLCPFYDTDSKDDVESQESLFEEQKENNDFAHDEDMGEEEY